MRIASKAAFAAGIIFNFFFILIDPNCPSAAPIAVNPCASTSGSTVYDTSCATVETVADLKTSTSSSTDPPLVYTSGYYNDGDGGGGILYAIAGSGCTEDFGTVIKTLDSTCYNARIFPSNVLQWGAYCDATNGGQTGGIAVGSNTFVLPVPTTKITNNESIVITGAGSTNGGTLAAPVSGTPTLVQATASGGTMTVNSNVVSGLTITSGTIYPGMLINDAAGVIPANSIVVSFSGSTMVVSLSSPSGGMVNLTATGALQGMAINLGATTAVAAVPSWVATKVVSVASSGTGFAVGQTITLSDGTKLLITSVNGSGQIMSAQVEAQNADSFVPANPVLRAGDLSTGFDMEYASSGQYWYGHDDYVRISNALAASAASPTAPGSDIYLPANAACGTGTTIQLPAGTESLRGYGANSSQIVALHSMGTVGGSSNTYVLLHTGAAGATGGGARELAVEGNMLATDVIGIENGQDQVWDGVTASDGTNSEWLCGGDNALLNMQMTSHLFLHIEGKRNTGLFPFLNEMDQQSAYNFEAGSDCTWSTIIGSKFRSGQIGIEDAQADWNVYSDDFVGGTQPYNVQYCGELTGRQHITNLGCDDSALSGLHIKSDHVVVQGVNMQWVDALPGYACGVLIESGFDYDYVAGIQTLSPNVPVLPGSSICWHGSLGANDIITGNPGSSVVAPGPATSAPVTNGQVYFSYVAGSTGTETQLCPSNGPGGLIINGVMQQIPANCAFLYSTSATGPSQLDYIYALTNNVTVKSTTNDGTSVNVTVSDVNGLANGDTVTIANVAVTIEANGTWQISNLNTSAKSFDLARSTFQAGFTSCGGSSPPCGTATWVGLVASTTNHVTSNGVEVINDMIGAETLVGVAWLDGSTHFNDAPPARDVASWYNRQRKQCIGATTTFNLTTTSMSYVIPGLSPAPLSCEFVNWGPPSFPTGAPPNVDWALSGQVGNVSISNGGATTVGFNNASSPLAEQTSFMNLTGMSGTPDKFTLALSGSTPGPTEGRNTIYLLGKAIGGGLVTWYAPYTSVEATVWQ